MGERIFEINNQSRLFFIFSKPSFEGAGTGVEPAH